MDGDRRPKRRRQFIAIALLLPSLAWGQIAFTRGEELCQTDPSGSYMDCQDFVVGPKYSVDLSPYSLDLVITTSFWEMGSRHYQIYVIRNADGEVLEVSRNGNSISDAVWSPAGNGLIAIADGRQFITLSEDKDMWTGSNLSRTRVDVGIDVTHVDWAPGKRFVVSNSEHIWITNGDSSQFLGSGKYPKVSPNGKKIAFVVDTSVWTMNLDGYDKKLIHNWEYGSSGIAWSPDSREIIFADGSSIKTVALDGTIRTILDVEMGVDRIEWAAPWDLPTGVSPTSWGELKAIPHQRETSPD